MSDLQKYKQEQMKNPAFQVEYERTRTEYKFMKELADVRICQKQTQKLQRQTDQAGRGLWDLKERGMEDEE